MFTVDFRPIKIQSRQNRSSTLSQSTPLDPCWSLLIDSGNPFATCFCFHKPFVVCSAFHSSFMLYLEPSLESAFLTAKVPTDTRQVDCWAASVYRGSENILGPTFFNQRIEVSRASHPGLDLRHEIVPNRKNTHPISILLILSVIFVVFVFSNSIWTPPNYDTQHTKL